MNDKIYKINGSTLEDIANTIRAQSKTQEKIYTRDFAEAIANLTITDRGINFLTATASTSIDKSVANNIDLCKIEIKNIGFTPKCIVACSKALPRQFAEQDKNDYITGRLYCAKFLDDANLWIVAIPSGISGYMSILNDTFVLREYYPSYENDVLTFYFPNAILWSDEQQDIANLVFSVHIYGE